MDKQSIIKELLEQTDKLEEQLDNFDLLLISTKNKKFIKMINNIMDNLVKEIKIIDERVELINTL